MVKVSKGKGNNKPSESEQEDMKLTKDDVETINRKLKNQSIIDAAEQGKGKKVLSGKGKLHRTGEEPSDAMLVYREKDATWYVGKSRILNNPDHDMHNMKIYEVVDQDRLLEALRSRTKFEADIMNIIIWKDTDTQDELVGWADPFQ